MKTNKLALALLVLYPTLSFGQFTINLPGGMVGGIGGGNGGNGGGPTVPKPDPKKVECEKIIDDISKDNKLPYRDYRMCSTTYDRDLIIQEKKEIKKCVEQVVKLTTVRRDAISTCKSLNFRDTISSDKEFLSCLKTAQKFDFGEDHVFVCQSYQYKEHLKDPNYMACLTNSVETYPYKPMMENVRFCTNPKNIENVSSSGFRNCKNELANIGIGMIDRNRFCFSTENQQEEKIEALKNCEKNLREVTGQELSGGLCLDTKLSLDNFSQDKIPCLLEKNKYLEEDFYLKESKHNGALTLLENFVRACRNDIVVITPAPRNQKAKLYGAFYFAHNSEFKRTYIGGLSGLNYNADDRKLYAVSDDPGFRQDSRYYEFDLDLTDGAQIIPTGVTTFKAEKVRHQKPMNARFDAEAILVNDLNEVIISTETLVGNSKSFIKIYNQKGDQIDDIMLPEKFSPKNTVFERTETYYDYGRGQGGRSGGGHGQGQGGVYGGNQPNPNEGGNQPRTRVVQYTSQTIGIQHNKGFEALTGNREGSLVFTANEAPLVQDQIWDNNYVRIVKLSREKDQFEAVAEYVYKLDNTPDNGLVEMTYLNENQLLTLERSFDTFRRKVTARIYLTNLEGARDYSEVESLKEENKTGLIEPVQKTLIIDLDDIIPSLPKGLNNIDNIEGMAVGPVLPNGKRSLILVTDNNFSQGQRTQFIVLEIL